jgi:hypothetical protein
MVSAVSLGTIDLTKNHEKQKILRIVYSIFVIAEIDVSRTDNEIIAEK